MYADTAADQWKLAEWCREHHLEAERKVHLLRVVEFDPKNADAHHALHQTFVNGQWQTQEDAMNKDGRRLYHGRWLTSQEIELMENKRKVELAEKEWQQKLKMWRNWVVNRTRRRTGGAGEHRAITKDPAAVAALNKGMMNENLTAIRLMYVEVLSKIESPTAPRTPPRPRWKIPRTKCG